MYQFSLPWFITLYYKSIKSSPMRDEVDERIKDLKQRFTWTIYQVGDCHFSMIMGNQPYLTGDFVLFQNICRSLFSDHTLIFSFILCVGVLGGRPGVIQQDAWAFFLTGKGRLHPADETSVPEDKPSFLEEKQWRQLVDVEETLVEFEGISRHVRERPEEWRALRFTDDPYAKPAPGKWSALRHVLTTYHYDNIVLVVKDHSDPSQFPKSIVQQITNLQRLSSAHFIAHSSARFGHVRRARVRHCQPGRRLRHTAAVRSGQVLRGFAAVSPAHHAPLAGR